MRYRLPADSRLLLKQALGPAAIADAARRSQLVNLGIPPRRLATSELMKNGGSMGSVTLGSIPYMVRGDRTFGGLGSVAYAEQGASVGGTAGSAFGPIGTAIGTIAGAIVGMIAKQGQGPERAAAAQQIDAALAAIPATAGVGCQIPWIGSSSSPGLQQFLQAIMTSGLYMNWDPSLISSPAVNGNWANTFITAVKQVTQAIIANPTGKQISLNITDKPGGNDAVAGTFNFINPGLSIGPDAISQSIIMGTGGLMYWMILRTGESTTHAAMNANSSAAQKVFALMIDHAAHDYAPQLFAPPPPPATINTVANAAVLTTPAIATPQPIGLNTNEISPVNATGAAAVAPSSPVPTASASTSVSSSPTPSSFTSNATTQSSMTSLPSALPATSSTVPWALLIAAAAGIALYMMHDDSSTGAKQS